MTTQEPQGNLPVPRIATKRFSDAPADLAAAAALIRSGEVVVFPTETVYGLGADASNPQAAEKIYAAKGRPSDNPLIVHVHARTAVMDCVREMNDLSCALADLYWPGPLTLILPKSRRIAERTSAGLATVGIRLPGMKLARDFLEACACPVAAPSANRSGRPSPTTFDMAWEDMEGRAAGVIAGPESTLGLESAILFAPDDRTIHLLRAGSLDPLGIRRDLAGRDFGTVQLWYQGRMIAGENGLAVSAADGAQSLGGTGQELPAAPGTRYRHYSPKARVILFHDGDSLARILSELGGNSAPAAPSVGLISSAGESLPVAAELAGRGLGWVWEAASLEEYSQKLYQKLREADFRGCTILLAWVPRDDGAFRTAIRDRLERASGG